MTRRWMYDGWNQVALGGGETQTVRTCSSNGDGALVYVEIDDEGMKMDDNAVHYENEKTIKGKTMDKKDDKTTAVDKAVRFMIPFNPEWFRSERKCIVRRLMPIEYERLMLYPDNHTKLSEDTADSSSYRQCGNGWAVNESTFIFVRQHIVDAMVEGFVKKFKFGTISSGVGCHELSVSDLGDESVFSSEIDPACCKLWDVRFPNTPNLGDMTRVTYDAEKGCICNPKYDGYQEPDPKVLGFKAVDKEYREIPFKYGELDVLSGGTPCTDYSVAGKRQGGAEGSNTRSALSYQMARIGRETGARWIVYENVPGIFSSHGGKDFLWFCHRLCEAGYTLAWRTFDAQYVTTYKHPRATPQRRRRVWLVGYRGTDWRIPSQVVFEKAKDLGSEPPMRLMGKGFLTLNPDFDPAKAVAKNTGKNRKKAAIEMELLGGDLFAMAETKTDEVERRKISRIIELSDFPDKADIREVGDVSLYQFGQKVGRVESVGTLFKGDESVDGINELACQNIGNAGIMSQGKVMTLTCAEWNAGIQLSPEQYGLYLQYEANKDWLKAEGLLPEAYDGTVCGIQDILEKNAPVEYWLSWKACWGVVRRAVERGKQLPKPRLVALVMRVCAEAGRVKWAAEHSPDTENGRKERRNALSCFESICHAIGKLEYEKVEALPPPKGMSDESEEDEDGIGDGGDDEDDGEGYMPGSETCGSLCACDSKGKNGQDAGSGKILDLHLKKNDTGDNEVRFVTFTKVSHPTAPNGDGERWDEQDVAQTRNTFDNSETRAQEVVVSTNSNGEEVFPTISACEYKMSQKQKDTGGGYVLDRNAE